MWFLSKLSHGIGWISSINVMEQLKLIITSSDKETGAFFILTFGLSWNSAWYPKGQKKRAKLWQVITDRLYYSLIETGSKNPAQLSNLISGIKIGYYPIGTQNKYHVSSNHCDLCPTTWKLCRWDLNIILEQAIYHWIALEYNSIVIQI